MSSHLDIMDGFYGKLDGILHEKTKELEMIAGVKKGNKKMTDVLVTTDDLNYTVKKTLNAINMEQERKLKASKAYKKKDHYNGNQEVSQEQEAHQRNQVQDVHDNI